MYSKFQLSYSIKWLSYEHSNMPHLLVNTLYYLHDPFDYLTILPACPICPIGSHGCLRSLLLSLFSFSFCSFCLLFLQSNVLSQQINFSVFLKKFIFFHYKSLLKKLQSASFKYLVLNNMTNHEVTLKVKLVTKIFKLVLIKFN